jgi:hypothetical protein
MVLHKKHLILKSIRESLLNGDSLTQARSLCRFQGYTDNQIEDTLKIFSDLEGQVDISDPNFWELLAVEIFNYVLNDIFFESYLESQEEGMWVINTQYVPDRSFLTIDYLRLLDICHYSGFMLYVKIPIKIIPDIELKRSKTSLEQFEAVLLKKKELGLAGELFVLEQEKKRLGTDFHVEHISLVDVSAGYDIKSWKNTLSFSKSNNLYIEVKTFSVKKEIYISENELKVAQQLGGNYRLIIVRKLFDKFIIYKIIDDFASYFAENKKNINVLPTYLIKF